METSIYLAKIIGPVLAMVGLSVLMHPKHYIKMVDNFTKDHLGTYLGSLMPLIIGLAIVLAHNVWVSDWRVIITVFGWLGLIKGIRLFLLPNKMGEFKKICSPTVFIVFGVIYILLGGYLSWMGYN